MTTAKELAARLRERLTTPIIPGIAALDRLNVGGVIVRAFELAEFLENRDLAVIPWKIIYEVADALEALAKEINRLSFVPGVFRCAKCKFRLVQSSDNTHVYGMIDPGEDHEERSEDSLFTVGDLRKLAQAVGDKE